MLSIDHLACCHDAIFLPDSPKSVNVNKKIPNFKSFLFLILSFYCVQILKCNYQSMFYCLRVITVRNEGNIFTGICDSVHGGGRVCLNACWDTTPPRTRQAPPKTRQASPQDQAGSPLEPDRHPRDRAGTPRDQTGTPPGPVPPRAEHTGRYGQRAGGMHPTGMQSC